MCYSVTDSEVNQGNKRFWPEMDSKVSKKVWKFISSLRIYGEGSKEDYEEEIRKMEIGYKDRKVSNLDSANIDEMELKRELSSAGVWSQLNMKESLLRQKARDLWLKEGDRNCRYFYKDMKARFRRNFISFVNTSDGRKEKMGEIKEEVHNFFEDNFIEGNLSRSVIDGLELVKLKKEDSLSLEVDFSEEEIKDAI
ncbi:hypothetical protein KIW84_076500 [Lathyrus oleraceus]|uniref:Uncharacterized protein n=1 Tax=Pisum sativum TaxID=3888 RepID=A0A9D4VZD1_PEA|nr:hypothetical protein KIW84_076500 [Pisum sativum]